MTILLSFIGTGRLYDTVYLLGGQEFHTPIIQEALCRYYKPEKVILFVTKGARSANLPKIRSVLSSFVVSEVDIPDGKCEEEIWEIFSIVTKSVSEKDTILFDITHGFRSLPFISLLSIAYLKEIRSISLSGVVYGAFEAGERIKTDSGVEISRAPVFDLTGFVSIFDWMAGVRSFLHHADAGLLNEQVKRISDEEFCKTQNRSGTKPLLNLLGPLSTYAEAVRLSRPVEAVSVASLIYDRFPQATEAIESYTPVLNPLLSKISDIGNFAVSESDVLTSELIQKQRNLIQVQLDMGLYQQAVTLGREWMVTVLLHAAGSGREWLLKNTRFAAENALTGAEKLLSRQNNKEQSDNFHQNSRFLEWFCACDSWKEMVGIWSRTSQLRNELAHCGMNSDSQKVQTLLKQVKNFPESMDRYYTLIMEYSK